MRARRPLGPSVPGGFAGRFSGRFGPKYGSSGPLWAPSPQAMLDWSDLSMRMRVNKAAASVAGRPTVSAGGLAAAVAALALVAMALPGAAASSMAMGEGTTIDAASARHRQDRGVGPLAIRKCRRLGRHVRQPAPVLQERDHAGEHGYDAVRRERRARDHQRRRARSGREPGAQRQAAPHRSRRRSEPQRQAGRHRRAEQSLAGRRNVLYVRLAGSGERARDGAARVGEGDRASWPSGPTRSAPRGSPRAGSRPDTRPWRCGRWRGTSTPTRSFAPLRSARK